MWVSVAGDGVLGRRGHTASHKGHAITTYSLDRPILSHLISLLFSSSPPLLSQPCFRLVAPSSLSLEAAVIIFSSCVPRLGSMSLDARAVASCGQNNHLLLPEKMRNEVQVTTSERKLLKL